MSLRHTAAPLAALLLTATIAGCTGAPQTSTTTSPHPTTTSAPQTRTPTPVPTPSATAAAATCESIISPGTVKALTDVGWSAEEREFTIGDLVLKDGLLCLWADYSVVSDHGQLYGWSPIEDEDAAQAQSWLLSQGWIREDGDDGTYITEDPQFSLGTDDDGYGMTYLFGDGWVKLSDTRQGLILIDGDG
ncbi:hypothetical protein [Microbacterium sp. XT11]|uniref:hypothetical protein n=1 Tax=Microbacterium sp. XT11 TaxID=367477 RepID=UPI0008357C98|nr:hypothetical protein [Microbacterium sp. XT11]